MQQPILFNTTIKDNIKFGVPGSSASKIFQVAEAANTLSFIESNYEELSAEEQLDETRKQIRHSAIHRLQNPELVKISKLSDLEALEVVKLVLENSDDPFNVFLDDEPQFFIDMVASELCEQNNTLNIKWDDFIL